MSIRSFLSVCLASCLLAACLAKRDTANLRLASPKMMKAEEKTASQQIYEREVQEFSVKNPKVESVMIGTHSSAGLSATVDSRADYIEWAVFRGASATGEPESSGKFYYGEEVLHNLPAGQLTISFKSCVERRKVEASKNNCGQAVYLPYTQKENTDTVLSQMLKERTDLVNQQKQAGDSIDKAAKIYSSDQSREKNPSLGDLVQKVSDAGPEKTGELIAQIPLKTLKEELDKEETKKVQEPAKSGKTDGSDEDEIGDSPTDGMAMIFMIVVAVARYGPILLKNTSGIDITDDPIYKRISGDLDDLGKKIVKFEGIREKILLDGLEKGSSIDSKKLGEVDSILKKYQTDSLQIRQDLSDFSAQKSGSGSFFQMKNAGTIAALVGAAVVVFTDVDEDLVKKMTKIFDEASVLELTSGQASAELTFKNSMSSVENHVLNLKENLSMLDQKIKAYIQK